MPLKKADRRAAAQRRVRSGRGARRGAGRNGAGAGCEDLEPLRRRGHAAVQARASRRPFGAASRIGHRSIIEVSTTWLSLLAFPYHKWAQALTATPGILDRLDQRVFDAIYARSLVYNTCWEDPAVDRLALQLGGDDNVLVITSAGCNVLDYLLTGPRHIYAVDANPRQNALLELKMAAIRHLDFENFFAVFGAGYHPRFHELYHDELRRDLSGFARTYWDRNSYWFASRQGSFYYMASPAWWRGCSAPIWRCGRAWPSRSRPCSKCAASMPSAGSTTSTSTPNCGPAGSTGRFRGS